MPPNRDVINRPLESGQTPEELRDFASSKDHLKIVLELERKDAVKLARSVILVPEMPSLT